MTEEITVRPVANVDEARAAAAIFDRVWQEQRVIGTPLLWAMASHGGQVLAAFRGEEIVGAQVGVVGLMEGKPTLHSHITGVLKEVQHHGVGFLLKKAQRDWCLERDIERVTWTFDPMVARNAYFNLVKLGAVAHRFHRNYYGEMDDAFNRGERSDRLEVVWDLRSDRVLRKWGGSPRQQEDDTAAPGRISFWRFILADDGGEPLDQGPPTPEKEQSIAIAVPPDYHTLRDRDPSLAHRWRDSVGDAMEAAFAAGYRGTFFEKRASAYVLERS